MKNRRMVLGIALIVVIAVSGCAPKGDPESDFQAGPIDGGKGVEITGYLGSKWEVRIPSKIQKIPVTHIGDATITYNTNDIQYSGSFAGKNLIRITIPSSVTSIGNYAFARNQLASVTIPNSVTTIGDYAFLGNQLTSVTIGNGVTSIGDYAFNGNQLTSVTIGNGVTTIGGGAFSLNQLTSVAIPNSVTIIKHRAFENNQLTSVTIGNSVTSIGDMSFARNQLTSVAIPNSVTEIDNRGFFENPNLTAINVASGNPNYSSVDGVLYNKDHTILIQWPGGKPGLVTIPNSVTSIGAYAFYGNQLTSITIPNSVTSIGAYAFYGNQLTSVTIPSSVTSIVGGMFANNQLTNVTIPNSVTSIGSSAFANNQLTSVTIGANVTLITGFFASFDNGFENAYSRNRSAAGTYTRPNTNSTTWSYSRVMPMETGSEITSVTGTWLGTIQGTNVTVNLTDSTWSMSSSVFSDNGSFNRSGNTGSLYSTSVNKNVGMGILVDRNTFSIILNSDSFAPGTYSFTRQ